MSHFKKISIFAYAICALTLLGLNSCGSSRNYLVVPHSVSTISAVSVDDLRLQPTDYEVLKTITETASVVCEYSNQEIKVTSGEGFFAYTFRMNPKTGWFLKSFSGAADLGYFKSDYESRPSEIPNPEEFARRAAMARIINMARDYGADAVVEPVCVTRTSNAGKQKVEYSCSVSAKLIEIKVK